jgi:hypothetical protein
MTSNHSAPPGQEASAWPRSLGLGLVGKIAGGFLLGFITIFFLTHDNGNQKPGIRDNPAGIPEKHIVTEVRGSLRGGAWVDLKNGVTVVLRGMPMELLRNSVPTKEALSWLIDTKALLASVGIDTPAVFDAMGLDNEVDFASVYKCYDACAGLVAKRVELSLARHAGDISLALKDSDNIIRLGSRIDASWEDFVKRHAFIASTETSIEGKYSFDGILVGKYYLTCGYKKSASESITWMLPVTVGRETKEVNLSNSNGLLTTRD